MKSRSVGWQIGLAVVPIVISLAMMLALTGLTWLRLAVWLVLGMIIYIFN